MPLLVTDYSWTQTDSTVYITLPLKGAKVGQVDILSTDEYLKVHYPPYLFEAVLWEPVDADSSTAKVGNGVAVFTLLKRTNRTWDHLMTPNDKMKKKEVLERALLKNQEKLSSESKSKAEKQHADKKIALKTMMKLEEEERESIKKMKDTVRDRTAAELTTWGQKQTQKAEQEAKVPLQTQSDNQRKAGAVTVRPEPRCVDGRKVKADQRGKSEVKGKKVALPAPRDAGGIQVTFTPRVFPTALRESRVAEEEEWLRNQAQARSAANANVEELKDLKEEERSPGWLKDKGDKCFAAGDYLGGVNAYNLAIRLNRKIPALYSNRAACHLKLRNFHKAVEDASQALDLLTPPVAANGASRARAHVRRGSAFCQLELYAEGLQDFQAALIIDPDNEALQADMQRVRRIIEGHPETQ